MACPGESAVTTNSPTALDCYVSFPNILGTSSLFGKIDDQFELIKVTAVWLLASFQLIILWMLTQRRRKNKNKK